MHSMRKIVFITLTFFCTQIKLLRLLYYYSRYRIILKHIMSATTAAIGPFL